jgi:hypothetical protein
MENKLQQKEETMKIVTLWIDTYYRKYSKFICNTIWKIDMETKKIQILNFGNVGFKSLNDGKSVISCIIALHQMIAVIVFI